MLIHIHIHIPQRTRIIDTARVRQLDALTTALTRRVLDAEFEEAEHPRAPDGKFTAGAGTGPKPTSHTAKSIKGGLHQLLSTGHPFSIEELQQATGVKSPAMMAAYLSGLKNPKYAPKEGHLAVVKRSDGLYHVAQEAAVTKAASTPVPSLSSLWVKEGRITTEQIFKHPPMDSSAAFPDGWERQEAKEAVVRIEDLVPQEDHVYKRKLEQYVAAGSAGTTPWAMKMEDGRYLLIDGNHRAAAEILKGAKTLKVDVVGVSEKAASSPAAPAKEPGHFDTWQANMKQNHPKAEYKKDAKSGKLHAFVGTENVGSYHFQMGLKNAMGWHKGPDGKSVYSTAKENSFIQK